MDLYFGVAFFQDTKRKEEPFTQPSWNEEATVHGLGQLGRKNTAKSHVVWEAPFYIHLSPAT